MRLLPELIPCTWLFELYQQTVEELAQQGVNQPLLRQFELALLEELGIGLDFSQLGELGTSTVSFSLEAGFTAPEPGLPSYSKQALIGFAQGQVSERSSIGSGAIDSSNVGCTNEEKASLYTAKLLMRNIINQLLGHKPLNSRKLFEIKR